MLNVQRRVVAAPAERVGAVIDGLADPERSVWPSRDWPRLVLDDGLRPGSRGGHGPIRYSVVAHEPGRRLRLEFAPATGLDGWHELRLEGGGPADAVLVHTISARTRGRMRVMWPLAVRWFHEALLQDLFDNAERLLTGTVRRPARWSPWVRTMRRVLGRSRRRRP